MRATLKETIDESYIVLARQLFPQELPEKSYTTLQRLYPPTLMKQWVNVGQEFVVRETECLYQETPIAVTGVGLGGYIVRLPADCYQPINIYWTDAKNKRIRLIPARQFEIDAIDEEWEKVATDLSTPENYIYIRQMRGDEEVIIDPLVPLGMGQRIKLYPKNNLTGTIELSYLMLPAALTTDISHCVLEGIHYSALIDYIVAKATGRTEDMLKLQIALQKIKTESRNRDKDEVLHMHFDEVEGT